MTPLGIVSMVNYVKQHNAADPSRVYVTGHSSGGMMTNVLIGAYPDVFKAGSAYRRRAVRLFRRRQHTWNTALRQRAGHQDRAAVGRHGARRHTPATPVPGRGCSCGTAPTTTILRFPNFGEEIKQWTNVLGVSQTPTSTEQNKPRSGWVRTRYGSNVEAIQQTGQPHNLQILADEAIHFFGLDVSTGGGSGSALVGTQSGRCLDVTGASQTNGARAQLWDCNGQTNQAWTSTTTHELRVYGTKCLDAAGQGTTPGTAVQIWDCNGQTNQQWTINTNGTITGTQSGLCLDAAGQGTTNGTLISLWACNGQTNQQWTRR